MTKIVERLEAMAEIEKRRERYVASNNLKEAATALRTLEAENVRLRAALTPSGDTKAAYHGEFKFGLHQVDEFGDEQTVNIMVPWDSIKEIMAAILARSSLSPVEAG